MNTTIRKLKAESIWICTRAGQILSIESRELLLSRMESGDIVSCLVSRGAEVEEIERMAMDLAREVGNRQRTFVFLIPRRSPPRFAYREDPPVRSFCCTANIMREFLEAGNTCDLSAYNTFSSMLAHPGTMEVYGVQYPDTGRIFRSACKEESYDWIIPHYGPLGYLNVCLSGVREASGSGDCASALLAIDGPPTDEAIELAKKYKIGRAYASEHKRNGPHALRNALVSISRSEFVVFQDSDDIPCANRLSVLTRAFNTRNIGMVGSHEIRIDDFRRSVIPVRYPLDVSAALRLGPSHALLHPTSAVRREYFEKAGGLSTFESHSMDSQFLLRSHFHFCTQNVDQFLYVRRWRAGSLCTSEDTGLGTQSRSELLVAWGRAFMRALKSNSEVGTALEANHGSRNPVSLNLLANGTLRSVSALTS